MRQLKTHLVGQLQRPSGKPENIELYVNQRPNITTTEAAAGIESVDARYAPGDVRRYFAKIDGTTDDTTAFQRAVDSGHPAFVITPGTSNIQGTIVMNGDKQLSLCADFNLERQDGSATTPLIHIYGQNNILNGNKADIRQDLYAHTEGIILLGPDPDESAGGTTDVDCFRNVIRDVKVIGPGTGIAQDGSPGIYIHSLKRKLGSYTKSNYYSELFDIHVVNCDVGIEFSSDANAHSIHGCFINQWRAAAIVFNGSYGNCIYGVKMESPLAVSATRRYAVHFLAQNGSTIETGTNASYSIDAARSNHIQGYAELPSTGSTVVSLFTFTETGTLYGQNKLDIVGQLVAGVGIDGQTDDDSLGTNEFSGDSVNVNRRIKENLHDFQFVYLDDDSGNLYGTDDFKFLSRREANLAKDYEYDLFEWDNVGATTAGGLIKLTYSAKETTNAELQVGEIAWQLPVRGASNLDARELYHRKNGIGVSEAWAQPFDLRVKDAAGTDANTGKFSVHVITSDTTNFDGFFDWWAVLVPSNLEGTNLDWQDDIKYLTTSTSGAVTRPIRSQQTKIKPDDETLTTDTTLQDDDDLQGFTLLPATLYHVEGELFIDSDATPDFKAQFTFSQAPVEFRIGLHNDNNSLIFAVQSPGSVSTGGNEMFRISGYIDSHATLESDFKLQWAQNTSSGTTTVYKTSWMRVRVAENMLMET